MKTPVRKKKIIIFFLIQVLSLHLNSCLRRPQSPFSSPNVVLKGKLTHIKVSFFIFRSRKLNFPKRRHFFTPLTSHTHEVSALCNEQFIYVSNKAGFNFFTNVLVFQQTCKTRFKKDEKNKKKKNWTKLILQCMM